MGIFRVCCVLSPKIRVMRGPSIYIRWSIAQQSIHRLLFIKYMGYLLKLLLQSIARQDMPVGAKSPHGSLFCQSHRLSVYMLPICNTYSSAHVENAI